MCVDVLCVGCVACYLVFARVLNIFARIFLLVVVVVVVVSCQVYSTFYLWISLLSATFSSVFRVVLLRFSAASLLNN